MEQQHANEHTALLGAAPYRRILDEETRSHVSYFSRVTREESALAATAVGERLPYNNYTSIDWLHDLIKEAYRHRWLHSQHGLRAFAWRAFDAASGWIVVTLIGAVMALLAVAIDFTQATVADLKYGYCTTNVFLEREECCREAGKENLIGSCDEFRIWVSSDAARFGVYVGWAALFGVISSCVTMLSKTDLPAVAPGLGDKHRHIHNHRLSLPRSESQEMLQIKNPDKKSMYMSAGSGIPEIKTILSGFVIPNYLNLKILVLKAVAAPFSVATGMSLGKEGPFIHIAACVGTVIANWFPKYRENGKQYREILTAACAAGLSAAFGAPIGGVLFAYEELSCYFPRKVLYRTFLCSMVAAISLRSMNPHKTGKLVLFETNYGKVYRAQNYLVFIVLGVFGGLWGGTFTRSNVIWAKFFRNLPTIKNHPVFEVFIIVLVTAALQYPNPATRARGDVIIRDMLVDCSTLDPSTPSWVCDNEALPLSGRGTYITWLVYGTLVQLASTTISFGLKVPAGIIIPALVGGALFGRLVGQFTGTYMSAGMFAMVGAAAFLAGVTRMTISLCVIMFELTGELEYVIPHMVAILTAKWTADALSKESIYDLAQTVIGHPFLNADEAIDLVREHEPDSVEKLIPPPATMAELTVTVPPGNKVPKKLLEERLYFLQRRGLMDGGLVFVQQGGIIQGYIAQNELEYGLKDLGKAFPDDAEVRVLGTPVDDNAAELDLSSFVDRAPISIPAKAPIEAAVEIFTKLGIRYLCITQEGTGRLAGFVIKKRVLRYLDDLKHEG